MWELVYSRPVSVISWFGADSNAANYEAAVSDMSTHACHC